MVLLLKYTFFLGDFQRTVKLNVLNRHRWQCVNLIQKILEEVKCADIHLLSCLSCKVNASQFV